MLPQLSVCLRSRDGFVDVLEARIDQTLNCLVLDLCATHECESVDVQSTVRIKLSKVSSISLVLNGTNSLSESSFVSLAFADRKDPICLRPSSASASSIQTLLADAVALASGRKRFETKSLDLVVSSQQKGGSTTQGALYKLSGTKVQRKFVI
jgi:hypothetical protein